MKINNCYACDSKMTLHKKSVLICKDIKKPLNKLSRPYVYLKCTHCPVQSLQSFFKFCGDETKLKVDLINHWNRSKDIYLRSWQNMYWEARPDYESKHPDKRVD